MFNPNTNVMKFKMRTFLLLPFLALILFMSCQDEVIEITPEEETEALEAASELTTFISATSKMDGSKDNIIDQASCTSIELPVTVSVNGLEMIIDSEEDYDVIEGIFNKFDDDDDHLEIIFPITIVLSDYSEIVLNNRDDLNSLIADCQGENEPDDDIECIDFQFPIKFSVYDSDFQVIETVTIEGDRQLHKFIKRVKNAEVFASLNFPVTMVLADESTVVVNNNNELHSTIKEQKDACDEDDDNDYGDDDFTKERLDAYLKICPWVVHEFERNEHDLRALYKEYALVFKEDNVVKMRSREGDLLIGTWTTRVANNGALIKLEFDNLADFTLEWLVYDVEYGKIKLYQAGGNRIIMKKNCEVVIDHTKERVESYLQECLWRISRISVDGVENDQKYIGTPLKFLGDNIVKLRVNGAYVQGTYEVLVRNAGIVLKINLEGRPNLHLEWLITFLEPGLIKLENSSNKMVLHRHCPNIDDDLGEINDYLISSQWSVTSYIDHDVQKAENYTSYYINFLDNGKMEITDPNFTSTHGSWLSYRNEGLYLGMRLGDTAPLNALNHRWKINEITFTRIELKDYNANGGIERILVLEANTDDW